MEEKIVAKGTSSKINIFTILSGIAAAVFYFIGFDMKSSGDSNTALWFAIALALTLVTLLVFWAMSFCEIVVTDKRIYGKVAFGKRVDLPMDSVSAVAVTSLVTQGVSVSTSSGRITFYYLSNRDDISSTIRELLIARQDKPQTTIKQEIVQSDAAELQRFKELLDSGVITQEEFDAKKKQLLGL